MMANNLQILLVEDEYDSVQMVSKILTHSGIGVRHAGNGNEAIAMLDGFAPDVVVMDLAMPHRDGWDTLVAMRSNPATAHIPVIAITAYHSANVAEDARQAGFDAYFAKPFNQQAFVAQLVELGNGGGD
jgi:CheY-like chemotaxis protein